MNYYSAKNKRLRKPFREAVIEGLPSDNGLFMPERITQLPNGYFGNIVDKTIQEVAFDVLKPFVEDDLNEQQLQSIIQKTFSFDFPLRKIKGNHYALELFHGPSYAFKDIGATFLALCLEEFYKDQQEKCTILVATSGDTGGAVAAAFSKVKNIEVVILYPSGKVSELQERQLTTFDENVKALEIEGDFDDCQQLVKQAFLDADLRKRLNISSANSINVARFLPQMVYYFAPFIEFGKEPLTIAVPSGNYGNLTAGLIAQKMGLPVEQFIAGANRNDVVPRYLNSGKYEPQETIQTISNAMDVGNPSNFQRMMDLFSEKEIKEIVKGFAFSDEDTLELMKKVYIESDYLLDPHGAVGYLALVEQMKTSKGKGIVLETAHPCKFMDVIKKVADENILPDSAQALMQKEKKSVKMEVDYEVFKDYLLQ
ncbi:threonine synthase [Marivirga tractuosa]|uniref:Threonine synthase n=1 Tax=Marivirga tractuosa (strain ATCC 23168 / DSM 4126 / NBRC 15989 / NCIMB 1408 / VKM B-1430 / H-43) TaxID=643867 RepID=E4TSC4_MARTH|nr:threonine synthase [Marivirga tractuosa]ADR22841.1 threonine synthase [Marivirga tractuosa DSM 4126]BDD16487.1 threonine synthase [Marivirga tractuosa]